MSMMDKLLKSSTIKSSAVIVESKVYGNKELIQTPAPMINVALSGDVNGGLSPGLLVIAGLSKHFKSAFSLLMAAAYQQKYEDAAVLFYDSEFGTPPSYMESFGIDMNRVIHVPIMDIEELKFDITNQFHSLEKGDRVCVVVDSLGNLASRKEIDDAKGQKSVADMTRAKQLKSLFRIVTPHLHMKDIPMIGINHTYKEIGMYPKDIVSGGTGPYYSADAIWIVGRQKKKDGAGYNFIIRIEKSRYVREESRIPISVTWEDGIGLASGLKEVGETLGFVRKPKNGWYEILDPSTGEILVDSNKRENQLNHDLTIWEKVLKETDFSDKIKEHYRIGGKPIFNDAEVFTAEGESLND